MKKFKILPLVLLLLLVFALLPVSALAVTEPGISAQAAILMDADSGKVYYAKNETQTLQPASTTKLVTALLTVEAIERGDISLSDTVTASGNITYNLQDDSTDAAPRIVYGEVLSVEDLLYCAMLASANEACNMLAEYISGSVSAFVETMNTRAQELGCTGTHFSNCNGIEDADHYTTAGDLALLAQEAVNHKLLQTVFGTLNHTVPATNAADARSLANTNALLNPESEYYYDPAYGIKTGYFASAGYCLVSAAQKDGINAVCVVLGGQSVGDQFGDTLTLYRWLFDNFESRQILSSAENIITAPVELGTAETVGVRAENGVSVILPKDFDVSHIGYEYKLYYRDEGKEALEAPVNAGQVLGELTVVELNDNRETLQTFGTSRLVAASAVEMSRTEYLQTQVMDLLDQPMVRKVLLVLGILLGVYLLLVLIYTFQRIRHLHSLRKAKRARARHQVEEDARWLAIPEEEPDEDPQIEYFDEPAPAPARRQAPPRRETPRAVETARPVETARQTPRIVEMPRAVKTPAPEETPAVETPDILQTPTVVEMPRPAAAREEKKTPDETPKESPWEIQRKRTEELHKEVFDDDFFDSFFKN